MTPERFAQLAQAYGAELRRWPGAEQAAARALVARGDARALEAQRQARWLDSLLDNHRLAAADPALATRIANNAMCQPPTSFWRRYAGWLSPAGFVGAGVAGVAVGILVASLSLSESSGHEGLPNIFDQGDADIIFNLNSDEGTEQ